MIFWLGIVLMSMIISIVGMNLGCYSNASIILSPNATRYANSTFEMCGCLSMNANIAGFQYDSNDQSCYTFGNDSSQSDIRLKLNSQVCFFHRLSMSYITTGSPTTTLPSPPLTTSTSVSGSSYYLAEIVNLNTQNTLTSLLLIINVSRFDNPSKPRSYNTISSSDITETYAYTNDSIIYTFELVQGKTIQPGSYQLAAQFNLPGVTRPTNIDTYQLKIQSYQDVTGHF